MGELLWAEYTDGTESHWRAVLAAPEVDDRTWWLTSDGCTVGCTVTSVVRVDRGAGVAWRVMVGHLQGDE